MSLLEAEEKEVKRLRLVESITLVDNQHNRRTSERGGNLKRLIVKFFGYKFRAKIDISRFFVYIPSDT